MKTKDYTNWAAVPMMVLLLMFWVWADTDRAESRRKEFDQQWQQGMRFEEVTPVQGIIEGGVFVKADHTSALLVGAEGAAISKALDTKSTSTADSNKSAAIAFLINAVVAEAVEHAKAGCHIWVSVDFRREEFKAPDWVCQKYRTGDTVNLERIIRYSDLAFKDQHQTRGGKLEYIPKFQ